MPDGGSGCGVSLRNRSRPFLTFVGSRYPFCQRPQPKTSSLQTEISSLQPEMSSLHLEMSSLQAEMSSLQPETSSLQVEMSSLQAETSSLQAETSSLQAETSTLQAEMSSLQAETPGLQPETSGSHPGIRISSADYGDFADRKARALIHLSNLRTNHSPPAYWFSVALSPFRGGAFFTYLSNQLMRSARTCSRVSLPA